ncbi:hypothetical protein FBU59_004763, partial [Linderina macrospora]
MSEANMPGADALPDSKAAVEWANRVAWGYDFCLCGVCTQQIEKGKVCPECVATYANKTAGANMVCCDICAVWVHTGCDQNLTPHVYDALITLEDAPYVCPTCCMMGSGNESTAVAVASVDSELVGLPACLREAVKIETMSPMHIDKDTPAEPHVTSFASPVAAVPHEPETEVANMLLSLTQSDVRFDRDRFDIDSLESQFCNQDS